MDKGAQMTHCRPVNCSSTLKGEKQITRLGAARYLESENMLTRLKQINQTVGHWLSSSVSPSRSAQEPSESEKTDGDLPNGAGFREPPADPHWRKQEEEEEKSSTQDEPKPSELGSVQWSELQEKFKDQPSTSRPTGLTRYRQTPGSHRSIKRFRKGIVLDKAG